VSIEGFSNYTHFFSNNFLNHLLLLVVMKKPKKKELEIEVLTDNETTNIALDTIKIGKQALVFVGTKHGSEKAAEDIARKTKSSSPELEKLSLELLHALSRPTKQCERLAACVKKGIAFHHAGLTHSQRTAIENAFRNGVIRVICATPTLAMGLDLPAYRVVIRDLRRFSFRGMQWIPVLEYLQIAGRAGRPKFDSEGQAVAVSATKAEKREVYNRYVTGEPEDIYSKLAVEPVLRTYLLSLIAANFVSTRTEIIDFFKKTFWAHQFRDMGELKAIIDKMLRLLEEWEFVSSSREDFVSGDEVGKEERVKSTILGKRVAELYIDPLTAHELILGMRQATARKVTPFSFLQLISSALEMRPLLRVKTKEFDKIQEALTEHEAELLQKEPSMFEPEYEDFLNSVKTALFFQDWIEEKDEEYLLENYNIRPGEIRVKLDNADWLTYSMQELCRILHVQKLIKEITQTRMRIKYGAKEELFPLLRLRNIGRVRARRLFAHRIRDIGDIKKADILSLAQIVGNKTAMDVKQQVGQEVRKEKLEVKEGKRKGQISLKDY
jgi:helicase